MSSLRYKFYLRSEEMMLAAMNAHDLEPSSGAVELVNSASLVNLHALK